MNIYNQLIDILPSDPLLIGEVTAHTAGDMSTIELPDGGVIRVRGTSVAVGSHAFVRAGVVEGPAPDLPIEVIAI